MLFASESRTASAAAKQQYRKYTAKAIPAKPAASASICITAKTIAAATKK
jgi:hypothetical protein